MRMTGFVATILAVFCAVAFLCGPVLAEEGEQKVTDKEVAAEIDKEAIADIPPVEAAPPKSDEEQKDEAKEGAKD